MKIKKFDDDRGRRGESQDLVTKDFNMGDLAFHMTPPSASWNYLVTCMNRNNVPTIFMSTAEAGPGFE